MMRTAIVATFLALVAVTAVAAPKFEKVPDQAQEMLKGTRSKSVSSGLVFVNGRYVKPSYRVARHGTAIFVNDSQVTGQVVPWTAFLATQDGYVPPAPVAKPVAAPPPKKTEKTVDDLFDDEPAPAAAPAAPAQETVAAAEPSGSFSPNEKSDRLLKKIEESRKEIRRRLNDGYICFFGSRYSRVFVEPRVARRLLEVLPEAIRDANDGADLCARLRTKGFVFMGRALCDDLIENRADYLQISGRREQIKDDERLGLTK